MLSLNINLVSLLWVFTIIFSIDCSKLPRVVDSQSHFPVKTEPQSSSNEGSTKDELHPSPKKRFLFIAEVPKRSLKWSPPQKDSNRHIKFASITDEMLPEEEESSSDSLFRPTRRKSAEGTRKSLSSLGEKIARRTNNSLNTTTRSRSFDDAFESRKTGTPRITVSISGSSNENSNKSSRRNSFSQEVIPSPPRMLTKTHSLPPTDFHRLPSLDERRSNRDGRDVPIPSTKGHITFPDSTQGQAPHVKPQDYESSNSSSNHDSQNKSDEGSQSSPDSLERQAQRLELSQSSKLNRRDSTSSVESWTFLGQEPSPPKQDRRGSLPGVFNDSPPPLGIPPVKERKFPPGKKFPHYPKRTTEGNISNSPIPSHTFDSEEESPRHSSKRFPLRGSRRSSSFLTRRTRQTSPVRHLPLSRIPSADCSPVFIPAETNTLHDLTPLPSLTEGVRRRSRKSKSSRSVAFGGAPIPRSSSLIFSRPSSPITIPTDKYPSPSRPSKPPPPKKSTGILARFLSPTKRGNKRHDHGSLK